MPIPGTTTVGGPVAPSSEIDTYAAHSEQWGRGGYRTVADYTERDAITPERRKEGQLVHVLSDDSWWELDAGLTNGNWIIPSFAIAANGAVSLERNGYPTRWFRPSANTNAARFAALQDAMSVADDNLSVTAIVTLMFGQFGIPSGTSIADFAPTNAVIIFGPESSVLYENENDATQDSRVYPGEVRYGRNFGVSTDAADNQPRIQAALFSMPSRPEALYRPLKYPDLKTRTGVLYLEEATCDILDSIWITAYQSIIGVGGRESVLALGAGFAPDGGPEKFAIETACWLPAFTTPGVPSDPGLQTGANFSFDVRIINVQIANQDYGNTMASAVRYGSGQGGELKLVTSAMGMRGVYMLGNTCHVQVHHLGIADTPGGPDIIVQKGPHLSGDGIYNCQFTMISEERLNDYPVADHFDYTIGGSTVPLACVMFYASRNLRFINAAGESNGNYMYLKSCHGCRIGHIDHAAAEISGHGDCLLRLDNCINTGFDVILTRYFEKAYISTGFGASSLGDPASTFFMCGPYNTTGDTFIARAGDPTTSDVPANSCRDVLNTTSGIAKRWLNNGGTLQSITYT